MDAAAWRRRPALTSRAGYVGRLGGYRSRSEPRRDRLNYDAVFSRANMRNGTLLTIASILTGPAGYGRHPGRLADG